MDLPIPSPSGTYHEFNGTPIYEQRFKTVGPFRFPGLAAVVDESGAYHIDFSGNAIYEERYLWVGDYTEDCAVVKTTEGEYTTSTNRESGSDTTTISLPRSSLKKLRSSTGKIMEPLT